MQEIKKPNFVKNKRLVKTTTFAIALFIATSLFVSSIGFAATIGTNQETIINIKGIEFINKDTSKAPVNNNFDFVNKGPIIPSNPKATPLGVSILSEGFEGSWLPTGWTQVITDTGTGSGSITPTWNQTSYDYHSGAKAAGLWWDYVHQDEWLITPQITLTGSTTGNYYVTFWTYGWEGSVYDDHYYVKISTDNGITWTPIFDLSDLTGNAWNEWAYPYTIDLDLYAGDTVKLAWQAIDCNDPSNPNYPGLWYIWIIDDIEVGYFDVPDNDVGVSAIIAPTSGTATGTVIPKVTVENFGSQAQEDVPVEMSITTYGTPYEFGCDGFESYIPSSFVFPSGWTIQTTNPTGTWYMYASGTTYSASTYPRVQEATSDGNAQNESLISPVIDCSDLSWVHVQFTKYFYAYAPDYANFTLYGSNDSGANWIQIVKYSATSTTAENINVSAWAAGKSTVQFKFCFDSPADTTLSSYMYFDNFWVGHYNLFGPLGDNPPVGWQIVNQTPPVTWNFNYWHRYTSLYTSYDSMYYPARTYYASPYVDVNCSLITPSINCSALSTVNLYLNGYFYYYSTYPGYGYIEISTDGGTNWNTVLTLTASTYFYEFDGAGNYYNNIPLPSAAGKSDVKIRFRYTRPVLGTSGYWYLGNVRVGSDRNNIIFYDSFQGKQVYSTNFKIYQPDSWVTWDWYQVTGSSTGNKWNNFVSGTSPTCSPYEGSRMAQYNAFSATAGDQAFLYMKYPVDVSSANVLKAGFYMFHDSGYPTNEETIEIFYKADGGAWISSGYTFYRSTTLMQAIDPSVVDGWNYHVVNLPTADEIQIGALATSAYGNNIYIDYGCLFDPGLILEYTNTTYVDIGAKASVEVEFAPWTPDAWHNEEGEEFTYDVHAETNLVNDQNPDNDAKISTIAIYYPSFYDVESVAILSPTSDGDAKPLPVKSTIKNVGQYPVRNFFINALIGSTIPRSVQEDFSSAVVPGFPAGWQTNNAKWTTVASANAGGVSPEARFYYSPSETGQFRLYCDPFSTVGQTEMTLTFRHYVSHYTTPYTLKVETSTDGGQTWLTNSPWSISPTASVGPAQVTVPLTTANGVGSSQFCISFTFDGYSWNINYWYVDDIVCGNLPPLVLAEYNESAAVTTWLNPGETRELDYITWTPSNLISPQDSGIFKYTINAETQLPGDSDPTNNIASASFKLKYWHDAEVKEITSPSIGRLQEKFYAFEAYPTEQSIWFLSNTPGDLNTIAPSTAPDFMAAGTWADGVWYASVYGTGALYTVDPETGTMTLIGGGGTGLNGLAYDDNTGTMYGASSTALFSVNMGTGAQTLIGTIGASYLIIDIAIDKAGVCYAHDIVTDSIYKVDLGTGAATLLGATGISANYAQGMGYDKDNEILYLAGYTTQGELYTVDTTNGHATLVGAFEGGVEVDALAIPYSGGGPGPGGVDIYIKPTNNVPISTIVRNKGTFDENDLTCSAKIYEFITDPENGTLNYSEVYTNIDLEALGGEQTLDFADYDFDEEGIYQLLIELPLIPEDKDDFPNNNMKKVGVGVDNTKPESTHALNPTSPDGLNGWYVNNVKVKLEAEDPEVKGVSSGIKEIKYKLDSDPEKVYTAEFTVSTDGPHTVVYYAVDNVGNAEEQNTVEFKIDKGTPEIALAYEVTGGSEWQGYILTFTATAADEQSGMDRVDWYYNNVYQNTTYGAGPTYVWVVENYDPDLDVTFKAIGYDNAGNNAYDEIERPDSHGQQQSMPSNVVKLKLNLGR